ncbi:MAG: hypothetical protein LDL41_01350 [Coleofasciculus sp. S288]|nr:hypothetical protein [Coleofasciculus sp. S288]
MLRAGQMEQVLQLAETLDTKKNVSLVASVLGKAGHVEPALKVARTLDDPYVEAWTMAEIASRVALTQPEFVSQLLNQALEKVKAN